MNDCDKFLTKQIIVQALHQTVLQALHPPHGLIDQLHSHDLINLSIKMSLIATPNEKTPQFQNQQNSPTQKKIPTTLHLRQDSKKINQV